MGIWIVVGGVILCTLVALFLGTFIGLAIRKRNDKTKEEEH